MKLGLLGDEVVTRSPEYEDCARLAASAAVPLREIYAEVLRRLDASL